MVDLRVTVNDERFVQMSLEQLALATKYGSGLRDVYDLDFVIAGTRVVVETRYRDA